jgi:hypothetical protein
MGLHMDACALKSDSSSDGFGWALVGFEEQFRVMLVWVVGIGEFRSYEFKRKEKENKKTSRLFALIGFLVCPCWVCLSLFHFFMSSMRLFILLCISVY